MLRIVAFDRAMAFGDAAQVAGHQHHVGALDGDVCAGADGNTHIGLRERRRIVDAVADEGERPCRRLQPLDRLDLAVGQHLGHHLVDAEGRAMASAVRRLSPVIIATFSQARAAPRWPPGWSA